MILNRWPRIFSLISLLTLAGACGGSPSPSTPQIIGGKRSLAAPYFVSLHYAGSEQPFCGGSLIEKDLVITAAHCVVSLAHPVEVWLAMKDLDNKPQSTAVEAIDIHPLYTPDGVHNDLALLHLGPVAPHSGRRIKPIEIAAESPHAADKAIPLKVIGFGQTARNEAIFPAHLMSVEVDPIPGSTCDTLGGPYDFVRADQICAGDLAKGKRDACYGDSGGPLVTADKVPQLFGIVSWGVGCGVAGKPGVYTRVSSFVKWINEHKKPSISAPHAALPSLLYEDDFFP
ncbi:MAG: serine protease [Chitinophagaceae bacterium]|nr:serine protease [Oligoflexus sp.]